MRFEPPFGSVDVLYTCLTAVAVCRLSPVPCAAVMMRVLLPSTFNALHTSARTRPCSLLLGDLRWRVQPHGRSAHRRRQRHHKTRSAAALGSSAEQHAAKTTADALQQPWSTGHVLRLAKLRCTSAVSRRLDFIRCSVTLLVMPHSATSSVSGDDMSTIVSWNSGVLNIHCCMWVKTL